MSMICSKCSKGNHGCNDELCECIEGHCNVVVKLEIQKLQADIVFFDKKATEAYKSKDFKLEDKFQAVITERANKIHALQNKLASEQYPNMDIEKEIQKMYETHNWKTDERCNGCAMKEHTTFMDKADGVRANWKESKGDSIRILESMKCAEKFK